MHGHAGNGYPGFLTGQGRGSNLNAGDELSVVSRPRFEPAELHLATSRGSLVKPAAAAFDGRTGRIDQRRCRRIDNP
jgi:hypothetical protein